ncbi:hypothetical protein RJZ56_005618 [Blastomyces dermatitidis]
MACITRRVTDLSAIAAFHIATVARMELELEDLTKLKKRLEKAQDQFIKLICDDDDVGDAYLTLEEAQDKILKGKETKEIHINEEEAVLMQLFTADDVSRMAKIQICACVQRLRANRETRRSCDAAEN